MRDRSKAALVALLGLLALSGPASGEPGQPAGENEAPQLRGFDPGVPAQATYADWPTDEALERLYGMTWSGQAFSRAALFGHPVFIVC